MAEINGNNLRGLRKAAELTMHGLADLSGVSHQTIVKIETNPNANPTIKTLLRLSEILGCKPSDIYSSVDAVPVVRCKDCKYHIDNRCYASNLTKYGNVRLGALTGDDYFCADGEKKND